MNECPLNEESLLELLDESLDPGQRQALQDHVDGCASCENKIAATQQVLGDYRSLPTHEPGPDVVRTILGEAQDAARSQTRRRHRHVIRLVAVVAAGILIGVAFAWFPRGEAPLEDPEPVVHEPSIDPNKMEAHLLALEALDRGDPQAALPTLIRILEEFPTYPHREDVMTALAEALKGVGRDEDALAIVQQKDAEFPPHPVPGLSPEDRGRMEALGYVDG